MRPRARSAIVIAGVLLLGGCASDEAAPESERIAFELLEVWRSGDPDLAADLLSATVVWQDPATDFEARGLPEVVAYLAPDPAAVDGLFIDVVEVRASDDHAVIEWIREGTVVPADGGPRRRYTSRGVTLIEVEGGRIVRGIDYGDPTPERLARGGSVVLPDGTELRPVVLDDEGG